MDRRRYLRTLTTGASVGLAGLAGCGTPGDEGTPGDGATNGTAADGTTGDGSAEDVPASVAMITEGSEYLFDPIGLYVEPGTTITWVNESGAHSATAYTEDNQLSNVNRIPESAEGWDSGTLSEGGAEFTHTFDVEGTYDYYCIPHKSLGMVARLVVGEPSGLEGDPPDGPVPGEQRIVDEGAVSQDEFDP